MTITKSIKFDKLQEENEELKKELAEKDKEHKKQLKRMYEQFKHDKELEIGQYKFEIEQQQLYKEDFVVSSYCINCGDELFIIDNMKKRKERKVNKNNKCDTCGWDRIIKLKDNLKYDKLDSKDVK